MLGVFICNPVMSLVDTAFVGASSSVELAALSPGTVLVCARSLRMERCLYDRRNANWRAILRSQLRFCIWRCLWCGAV
jgi:hypothetical protein